ncbi:PREDICTED: transposon, partial [Prunus dulcis]
IWTWHREPWEWTTNASRNVEEDEQSRFSFVYEEVGMDDNDLGDIGFDPYEFANVIGDGDQPLCLGSSVLLWTINDFPAYGNLSGCVVKGYKACPICGDDTPSHRLKNGHKICYIGHRKWLPINHPYRRQRAAFNGKPEYGTPPEPLHGEEVLRIVEDINYIWGSKNGGSVGENDGDR